MRLPSGDILFGWKAPGHMMPHFLSIVTKKGWKLVELTIHEELNAYALIMTPPNEEEAMRFIRLDEDVPKRPRLNNNRKARIREEVVIPND